MSKQIEYIEDRSRGEIAVTLSVEELTRILRAHRIEVISQERYTESVAKREENIKFVVNLIYGKTKRLANEMNIELKEL